MKKIVFLLALVSITFTCHAQQSKAPADRFAFNVAKGSTFENVTIAKPNVVPVTHSDAQVVISKDITLKIPGREKTFLVSDAQYQLLKEVIARSSVQIVVNLKGEMFGYVEFQ